MDLLVTALGPVFVTGFAVQQLLEIIGPLLEKITSNNEKRKKVYLSLLSLIVGMALSFGAGLHVLVAFNASTPYIVDGIVSGLIISGGTEGINSIMKFLGYSKEKEKANAASAKKDAGEEALKKMA